MPANQTLELTHLPAAALLQAVAMPDNLQGMAHALPQLRACIDACCHMWPTTPASIWQSTLADLQMRLNDLNRNGGDLGLIYTKPVAENGLFSGFLKWQRSLIFQGVPYALDALLGRAIVTTAAAHQQIPTALITGFVTVKTALEGKGKRSADWDALVKIDLINPDVVENFRITVGRHSPTQIFLASLHQVLQSASPASQ